MHYVISVERMGIEKGIETGALQTWRQAIAEALETRFEIALPKSTTESLNRIQDLDTLKALFKQTLAIGSLEEFQQFLVGEAD